MAGNRIKGITIQIDGNTTKLQESLKDVNASLKKTQTELNDVNKLLKLDPKNMDLLAQKQELLAKQTDNVADKLKKLREAQEQMKASGVDAMSENYMRVQREIVDCENEQKRLTEEAKKTDEAIVKIGSGFDKVATKAQKAADATAPLSKAAAAGVAGMAGLAVKAAASADEISTLSKQSGIATDTIQKMQYASELIDVDMETAVSAVAKLKKGLDKNEETLVSMGVSVRDQNGQYRDMESIFMNTIAALSKIENETERDKVAMDLFGKSADELAGYIDDGGRAYRELAQAAQDKGLIISQEDLDKANEFNDTLDELKATVGMDLLKAGADIGQALLPVLQSLAEIITKIVDAFANLGPTGQTVVMVLLALLAALSPVLGMVAKVATILPLLQAAIPAVSGALGAVAGVLSGPVLLAIGAVVAAIVVLVKNWDDVKQAAILMYEIVSEKWDALKEKVSGVIDTLKTKIQTFLGVVQTIWNSIREIFKGELPIPKLKLPHIKITGSWSLKPPSAPNFSVDWYKKAMDEAYIMNSPTIFGAQGNTLLGGGEAGSETIVGTEKLMNMMSEVMGDQNVTVVLQGDAAEIFRVVRVENSQFYKSHGYSPLTGV